ncbi:hypothetical protein [Rhizobium sp. AAP43]|uniref:hypothetical protein n=1 Tax=Rhizobium sp. AAP43 TaxID=1523420 RepID=UPI0006B9E5CA|nr:hypothetical protein [Rhizobium sp. AAP43]KPF41459.1 hypothetical protein IP76_20910 [Rhizobium sp. AAP43]
MGEKRKRVYEALVDGATEGLSGDQLFQYIKKRCPKVTSKKLVRSALLALTDDDITDRHILDTVYALAIKHRLNPVDPDAAYDEEDDAYDEAPSLKALKHDIIKIVATLDDAASAKTNNS